MLLEILQEHKAQIEALARRYGAGQIRVFGSVARREEGPHSDIDLLVVLPSGYDLFAQRLPLTAELEALLGRPVDLIPEHELNQHLRSAILKEALPL
ncbi:MAG: nucleotidyltransferase family protein [Candidatus Sericytochromatia bacterium]|nr:nucleotidyltransferase family protein [Candidatus Sericytochromatia bacterium]